MRAPSLDWIVRAFIGVNVVLLILAAVVLFYVAPIHAAGNGPPPLEGLAVPVDDGNPEEISVTICVFGF